MTDVTYRWIDGAGPNAASDEEWQRIDDLLSIRGWASLNRETSRILVAEEGKTITGFNVFQMVPYCGPLYVTPSHRGTGLAQKLADKMIEFLTTCKARGWIAAAGSSHSAKMCEQHGMSKVEMPVYVMGDIGTI